MRKKQDVIIISVIVGFILLLSALFLIDYFKPKTYKGYFKCVTCSYVFTKEVSSQTKLPLLCPKCKNKTVYLAGEFFCPKCNITSILVLDVPPWEAEEKGEPLQALYMESLMYTINNKKVRCSQCGEKMTIKDETLKGEFQKEEEEIKEKLKNEEKQFLKE